MLQSKQGNKGMYLTAHVYMCACVCGGGGGELIARTESLEQNLPAAKHGFPVPPAPVHCT